jgi:hypothetical protein
MELILTVANVKVKEALNIIFFQLLVQQIVEQQNLENSIQTENLFVMIAKVPVIIVFLLFPVFLAQLAYLYTEVIVVLQIALMGSFQIA